MPPVESLLVLSTASLAGIGLVAGFAAWAWAGWLRLRAEELRARHDSGHDLPAIGQRIDLADLKERIRKLEAIAAGVDF
ncbi:MAG: hypothetical protein CFE37_06120 [Alphaproteobacteria bacterium PA4]|nr:MAG: hypothetical protein CFE37_06120 [Alphaproteobacteria bacterium PA4]